MTGCCGQRRAAVVGRSADVRPGAPSATAARPPLRVREERRSSADVRVEYSGHTALLVRGPDTGRLYAFSAGRRVRSLPRGDAQGLLRSPLFRDGAE